MPDNKQDNKSTEIATIIHESTLTEKDLMMMEYKIMGLKYKDIVNEMIKEGYEGVTEDVVKTAFRVGGPLYDIYPKYKVEVLTKRASEGNDLFKAHYVNAVKSLVSNLKEVGSPASVISAKEIVERVIGKVPNVNFNFDQDEFDAENDEIKQMLAERKARKKKEEKEKESK